MFLITHVPIFWTLSVSSSSCLRWWDQNTSPRSRWGSLFWRARSEGCLFYSAFLHWRDHLSVCPHWFEGSWWWIQNTAAGQRCCCSDVKSNVPVQNCSTLFWVSFALADLAGWAKLDGTSLACPIGVVTRPCLSLDSSGPRAWQLLPMEQAWAAYLLHLFLSACLLWEFFRPSVHFLVCCTKSHCDNQPCCFLGGILCFHKLFWNFASCTA